RRRFDASGRNVERPAVEIALDDLAVDLALGKGSGTVRARIVGDEEPSAEIEHGEDQSVALDLDGRALGHFGGRAEVQKSGGIGHVGTNRLLGLDRESAPAASRLIDHILLGCYL